MNVFDVDIFLCSLGNVLTDIAEGETAMIPQAIMDYSIRQGQNVDLKTTLDVLSSPGREIQHIPGGDQSTDPVVR